MLNNEKYIQTTFNFIIDRKPDIRRFANEIEDELKNYYMPPQINGIPDDVDPTIPRISFQSRNSHSTIYLSPLNIMLDVIYDENYKLTEKKEYLFERIELLKKIIKKLNLKINFMGLTTVVVIPTEKENSVKYIKNKYFKNEIISKIDEIFYREAKIIDEKYYSNISIESYKIWENSNNFIFERLSNSKCKEYGIKLTVDFNDRYSFNENENYNSSIEEINNIIEKNFIQIKEQLDFLKRKE